MKHFCAHTLNVNIFNRIKMKNNKFAASIEQATTITIKEDEKNNLQKHIRQVYYSAKEKCHLKHFLLCNFK